MNGENDTDQPVKTAVTIVPINGRQFVAGLFWQPLTRPRAYMKEAREIGKREGMDIVAIRHSVIMQAGFVAKNQGVLKGMYSLAASLASQLGNSWLGVFEIDEDQFALVAVHDGAIVPGCDLIGDRDEISNKLRVVYNYFNWEKVYAPASFEFGGEPLDIKKLLHPSNLKKENQLRPLTFGLSPKEWGIAAAVLVLVLGGLFGYAEWMKYQEKQRREAAIRAEQARRAELEKLNAKAKQEMTQKALDHPWAKQPAPEDFARECVTTIYGLQLVVEGWVFQEAKCTVTGVKAVYKRKDGTSINEFLDGAKRAFTVPPAIASDGDSGSLTFPLEMKYGGDDPLRPVDVATSDFSSQLQKLGIAIKLTERPVVQPQAQAALPGQQPAKNGAQPPMPVPDWKTFIFKIETEIAPEVVFAGARADGLRFTEMSVRLLEETPKLIWNVAGELNAK